MKNVTPLALLTLISWDRDGTLTAQCQTPPFRYIRQHVKDLILHKKLFSRFSSQDKALIRELFKIYDEQDRYRKGINNVVQNLTIGYRTSIVGLHF